jgi:ribosomal protein S18 acetylase RimI-like enzyme
VISSSTRPAAAATPRLREARLDEPAARPLLAGLAKEYSSAFGQASTRAEMTIRDATEFLPPDGALLVLETDRTTVAGGGLARLGDGIAEIKRMWTAPEHRRRGHARRLLTALEQVALARGYTIVRLQTADALSAALALYRAAGYRQIPPFGPYRNEPRAIGFEKLLASSSPPATP